MNRVRKNAKKITELANVIREEGPMSFIEIKDWMNARLRNGVTSSQLGNNLAKCGLFEKVGMERVHGFSSSYMVTVWGVKKDEQEG
jgi:hypothetical protein